MGSAIRGAYHKKLFLMLLAFSWGIIISFMTFQYFREKHYKYDFVSDQLQMYNRNLLTVVEDGLPYEDYIRTWKQPFEQLRVSIITLSGAVIYDNTLPSDSLDNHRYRPEIDDALRKGSGYHIGRQSVSDGREYFYSATKGERVIVRSAIPYSASLSDLLKVDWTYFGAIIIISLAMTILAYFATGNLAHKAAMLEQEEKSRLKRQLTDNINHELKTPVASIQVCLETLLSGISLSEEKRQEFIERCYINCNRLRKLLDDISLITRMEDGSRLIEKESVTINSLIGEIAEELNLMPEEERYCLHTNFADDVTINGNVSLIGSIFRNLTENAIAYSGGKNIFILLVENTSTHCRIRFEDDGCGVEEHQLQRLFERFYRADKGRSRKFGGTGLGLAIVKHAVLFHGGSISVCNRPGGGLRFEFMLKK